MPQVLEIPPFNPTPFPDGGANLPADVPPLVHRSQGAPKVFDSLVNMYKNKRGGLFSKDSGCCPCQGNRPHDQTPYQEPRQSGGLQQPQVPVKPFQQPKDPCDITREKLMGLGISPEELNDCLRGGSRRSTARSRTRRSRRKQKTTATISRYYSRLGKRGSKKSFVSSGKEPTLLDVASQLASMPRRKKKRKSRANAGAAAARTVGKYKLLSNGACYDPRTRKFVKRANCR